jgi:acetylornithine deacetylase
MNVPSVSGEEEAVGFWLRDYLESIGWTVELQKVSDNQNNVIAWLNDTPRLWFSTHIDTVPPFIPPTEDDEKIYGRGACDAKGIIAAQITAAEELRKQGIEISVCSTRSRRNVRRPELGPRMIIRSRRRPST